MTVPFPRTKPDDAPEPPAALLDQRAARVLFLNHVGAIGYRLADEGVYVELADGMAFHPWADVRQAAADHANTDPMSPQRRANR